VPEIINASAADIALIQDIAEKTWWPTYSSIVPEAQIRYMLDAIYSTETLLNVIQGSTQHFILIKDEDGVQGFASFGPRSDERGVYKLHKIYVLPDNQGKGYGAQLVAEVKRRLKVQGIHTLDLNVNRFNKARDFYERLGFTVIREEDVPIGPYWMNDYVMRLTF